MGDKIPPIDISGCRTWRNRTCHRCKDFVFRNFYVDNGLPSVSKEVEAIDLLQCTKALLAKSNLRLHKIASNSAKVMEAFPPEE